MLLQYAEEDFKEKHLHFVTTVREQFSQTTILAIYHWNDKAPYVAGDIVVLVYRNKRGLGESGAHITLSGLKLGSADPRYSLSLSLSDNLHTAKYP